MLLRPGNAGSNTAADHRTVIDRTLAQIPAEHVETCEILIRADSAGATTRPPITAMTWTALRLRL